jgi:hypothetical protein
MTTNLVETTVRDFGGGWNVSDSDKSLTSKYQTISDNIVRQTDGSFSIRPGTRLFADMKQGTETVVAPAAYTVSVSTSVIIAVTNLTKSAVGGPAVATVAAADIPKFANGQTINFIGADATHSQANGYHVISSVNSPVNTFAMAGVDTSAAGAAQTTGMTCSIYVAGTAPGVLKITKTAHGYTSGMHVNITSWSSDIAGITAASILGNHGIVVHDANTFSIYVRALATATTSLSITIGYTVDNHAIGGRDIFGRYYKDNLFVFSDTGEIVAIDKDGTVTQVWNYQKAAAISIQPWGPCKRISAEIVRGKLIAVNGSANDKPLEINGTVANYLVDPSTVSNANIPRADFVVAADRYVLLISTEYGATKIDISQKNTTSIFQHGGGATGDAVEIDIGMVTQTVDTTVLGANVIRSRVFIGFQDRSLLGTLGVYTTATPPVHEPDFKDNVAQLGSFSHASIISLGNDLLCAGLNGVNSLEISRGSGEYTPATLSDFVHPVMLRHFARLSEEDRRYRSFAVWDVNYRSYMLFLPKYSDISYTLPQDAVIVSDVLQPNKLCFLLFPSHVVDAGDYIDISGVTGSPDGKVQASMVNGRRRIRAIQDDDTLVVEIDPYPLGTNYGFGGTAITVKPVNDESPAYVYEYNKRLKITRWTRFRGLDFDWGAISQLNKLFFGKLGRIYRFGNNLDKYSADKIGDYTKRVWANSTAYAQGDRVNDAAVRQVYICMVAHTSPSTGTFKQYRDNPATRDNWEEFKGLAITWEMETAWTDFKDRKYNKQIEVVSFDTEGSSDFEFSIYTDTIRTDFESYQLIPNRTTIFIGQDAPGFGAGMEPFGGGRNTRQEWLRGMPVYGKLFRLRFAGSSVDPLQVNAATMYYHKSRVLT